MALGDPRMITCLCLVAAALASPVCSGMCCGSGKLGWHDAMQSKHKWARAGPGHGRLDSGRPGAMGSKLEVASSARNACLPLGSPRKGGGAHPACSFSPDSGAVGMRAGWSQPPGFCSGPSFKEQPSSEASGKQGWLGRSLLHWFGQQEREGCAEQSRRGVQPSAAPGGLLPRPPVASSASGDSNQAASSRGLCGLMDTQCFPVPGAQ